MKLSPSQSIMLGFAGMILSGAFLLNLPIASASGESVGFLDALFTATSANCVTGLVVVNTKEHWSLFGKAVLLLLIQMGALGFITVMTVGLILLRKRISLRNRLVIQTSFNQDNTGGMVRLIRKVLLVTVVVEAAGAVLLTIGFWASGMPLSTALPQGVFHSISAFCNAGFDNIGTESLVPYQTNWLVNGAIMALIIAGGLGFTVWSELAEFVHNRKRSLRKRLHHLSLHSKITLLVTGALLVGGFLLFLLIEWHNPNTLGPLSIADKGLAAMFQSVTLRTAGYNSISQAGMHDVSKFISCILMLTGGSPASTAGGIKTATVGVILVTMLSVLRGRNRIEVFGRTLPLDLLQKALTVISAMMIVVMTSAIILFFTEGNGPFPHTFLDLLFESCSAAGTVGVTTGITPHLSPAGKVVMIFCMYLGRLSPVTVVAALNMKLHKNDNAITYPSERVIIG